MIKIDCNLFSFEARDHLIIWGAKDGLCFDSATNKSRLFKEIAAEQEEGTVKCNLNLILSDRAVNASHLQLTDNDCLLVDELNYSPRALNIVLENARKANAYLIVIGRMLIKQFEYSVDDIYGFEFNESYDAVTFERIFTSCNKTDRHANIVACEDSAPIATIYSNALDTDVVPVFGRSRFYSVIKRYEVALLIADRPKFGADLLRLLHKLKDCKMHTVLLFAPYCFDEILCQAGGLISSYDESLSFDQEYYFESLATREIPEWNKNHLARSLAALHEKGYVFKDTKIINLLKEFYNNCDAPNVNYCYEINLGDFSFVMDNQDISAMIKGSSCTVISIPDDKESNTPVRMFFQ